MSVENLINELADIERRLILQEREIKSKDNEIKSLKSLLNAVKVDNKSTAQVFYKDQPVIVSIGENINLKRYYSHRKGSLHFVYMGGVTSRSANDVATASVKEIYQDLDAKPLLNWIDFKPFAKGDIPKCEHVKILLKSGHMIVRETTAFNWCEDSIISKWASLDEEV